MAGRTLNTDCGVQYTLNISSGVNGKFACDRISFCMDLVIVTLVGGAFSLSSVEGIAM